MLYNKHMNILGINVSEFDRTTLNQKIAELLDSQTGHYLVTPNPEIILAAHKDEEFFYILNQADLAPADGFGLKIAAWLSGRNLPRISGSDLCPEILHTAEARQFKIALLNWSLGLSKKEEISAALNKKYPGLNFLIIDIERKINLDDSELKALNEFAPKILFSALGAPIQEKIIWHNLKKIPSLRLALGVGGSFDFLSGQAKRAPKFLRYLGLEWLWRLIRQPQRISRIFNATIVFLGKIFIWRFIQPWRYRPNVVCFLYRATGDTYTALLVERTDEAGHWQFPQGGTDGESLATAGARELREEIGTDKFVIKNSYPNLYRYQIKPRSAGKYGYRGQKQGLCLAEFFGQDSDIKVCFWDHVAWKWVKISQLAASVHPLRRLATEISLNKFKEYIESEKNNI